MATTDPSTAHRALAALDATGIAWAFLHGASDLDSGAAISDIDLVIDRDPGELVHSLVPLLASLDLYPIFMVRYDVGGSAALYAVSPDLVAGVQLDLFFDPFGRGMYGLRSPALLESRQIGIHGPEVEFRYRLIYLWLKRGRKGQLDELAAVRDLVTQQDPARISQAVEAAVTHAPTRRYILRGGIGPAPKRPIHIMATLIRRLKRITHPPGVWVHTASREIAQELKDRLHNTLPNVACAEAPRRPALDWWARNVARHRFRAGVLFTFGPTPNGVLHPDLVLSSQDAEPAARELVRNLEFRVSPPATSTEC